MNQPRRNRCYGLGAIALCLLGSCSTGNTDPTTTETIQIGGSSETLEVIEAVAEAYEASGAEVEIEFLPPSQSSGGIEGVKAELLDIGAVSRELSTADLDNEQYIALVNTPLVIAVHETVTGIDNLTATDLKGIYDGTTTNWQTLGGPDAEIVLLDVAEDENEKALLRNKVLGAELQITGEAIVFPEDDELLGTASTTPYSLTVLPLEAEVYAAPLKVLSLDGVAPTPDNVSAGTYDMLLALGIVVTETPAPTVQAFIDFMLSPEGEAVLAESIEAQANDDDDDDD
jgi:phosphate transport system substrate-binding protein